MFGASKYRSFLRHPGYNEPTSIMAVVSAVATVGGVISSVQQADAQKKSIAAQEKMANVEAQRARIQAAREARIKRAQILASSGNQGIGASSSGVAGAVSSIGAQEGGNIAHSNIMQDYASQASKANQQAADANAMGAMWQSIGNISGSMTDWKSIFGGGKYDWMDTLQKGRQMKKEGVF